MAIADEDVARVRAATDFVALATEHIALRRQGQRWVGLCPFHAEKTPSFSINAEEGLYYCFGCQASGDVITFVREVEHLDFVEAVEALASKAGIQLRYDEAAGAERRRQKPLQEAMEKAVEFYHRRLLESPDAGAARRYLRQVRGYDSEVVRRFRLGWAPSEWDALARGLKLSDDVLRDTGLGFVNRRGRRQDAFRARIMFPIFDPGGRPVAFGGRVLPEQGADGPKYKNSPDTPIYSKRRTLYGLNWAKAGVVEAGEVVVCEGYTDVIAFFLAGLPRAVATCGTALADEHFRLIKNFARRVVLAYDADSAGEAATARFHEWETRYEIDIAVAALPKGQDPADVARRDPEALKKAVEEALPFLGFRVDRVLEKADLAHPEGRARAAQAALAVIAEHPNQLVRDQYIMVVADRCRIDPARLRQMSESDRSPHSAPAEREAGPARSGPTRTRPKAPGSSSGIELAALRLAVQHPAAVAARMEETLFVEPVHQAAFRALATASTLHEAIADAEPEAAALLQRLAVEEGEDDADDVTARLAWAAASRALQALEAEARVSGEERLADIARRTSWLKLTMESLSDGAERVGATERLVAWLAEQAEGDR
ncbi:MAG TPA: DNA primase [Acidimicrobiales bacterium]|nr:DNA primase [Acidimicrobiales bacterium]